MATVFDMVVAMDRDRGIARCGDLPWHLPGDLAHFRKLTSETTAPAHQNLVNAVIMGRKTWDTIPKKFRPLPGRLNVVVSRSGKVDMPATEAEAAPAAGALGGNVPAVLRASSLEQAFERLAAADLAPHIDRVFVVGGGEIYAQAIAMPACRDLYITRIDAAFACDTLFPPFESQYQRIAIMAEARENDLDYRIEIWRNREHAHA